MNTQISDEASAALVDLVSVIQEGQASTEAISNTLMDILDILRKGSKEKEEPINVTVHPAVSVNPPTIQVNPTPVNITPASVNVVPAPVHVEVQKASPWDCEITHEWEGERIVRSYVRRIKPGT
jgi:hypothetical protein